MTTDRHTNCEAFFDGTNRWLWQVIYQDRTWRAGVSHNAPMAQRDADTAMQELDASLNAVKATQGATPTVQPMLDLDALDGKDGPYKSGM